MLCILMIAMMNRITAKDLARFSYFLLYCSIFPYRTTKEEDTPGIGSILYNTAKLLNLNLCYCYKLN